MAAKKKQVPSQKPLLKAADHGYPINVPPLAFSPRQRNAGWGVFLQTFIRYNEEALTALDVQVRLASDREGATLELVPGGSVGAAPLCSAQTGQVVSGVIVEPRFGWTGIGRILSETSWSVAPEFLRVPMVPGSGREIPPWVLAGPILKRLHHLIRSMRRGFRDVESLSTQPRGTILWPRYTSESLASGRWHQIPCRFNDLSEDQRLRRYVRWALERVHSELVLAGGSDLLARALVAYATRLLGQLTGVVPLSPRRQELSQLERTPFLGEAIRRGVEALGWIVEERGLGGGRELDGLAWSLPLDRLWEAYVEAVYRREAAQIGATVKVARLRETTIPVEWSDPTYRSVGHLVPDIVLHRGSEAHIVDAKYKSHLADLDERRWHEFSEDALQAHRADLHQVLAYSSLFDATEIRCTLVYPVSRDTWQSLKSRGRDVARAALVHGGRKIELELRGLPFGGIADEQRREYVVV